jgi:hypothetical protein
MHFHLEVILPPVEDLETALDQILGPFQRGSTNADGTPSQHTFWDWYVIGGCSAGAKVECTLDAAKLDAFFGELANRSVTVSSVVAGGKQTLRPDSQIPMVDALWSEMFPESQLKICPLFDHFHRNHTGSFPDIVLLKDMPMQLEASRVIIAGPKRKNPNELEATYMMQAMVLKGERFVATKWDGKVQSAIDQAVEKLKNNEPDYARRLTPQAEWLVVTVDYHS